MIERIAARHNQTYQILPVPQNMIWTGEIWQNQTILTWDCGTTAPLL